MAEPATPAHNRAGALTALAYETCIFPMVDVGDLRDGDLQICAEGRGVEVTDIEGRTFLDMVSGAARANSLGYGNAEIVRAIAEQLERLHHLGARTQMMEPTIHLAAKLAQLVPGDLGKSLFMSGGSEAVETAFKLAKQYHRARGHKPHANKIVARWGAYHGATMGALGATDSMNVRQAADPPPAGYIHVPAPTRYRNPFGMGYAEYGEFCAEFLEEAIVHEGPANVAAFIAEPIMQGNGVQIPPPGYLPRVREICDRHDVVFIADEIITGFGRTGEWFGVNHFGVVPDIMLLAKAISAGYFPLSALVARPEICDAVADLRHTHCHMGNPAASAAALANIAIIERDGLVARSKEKGAYFLAALRDALDGNPIVGEVRGRGLWLAVDLTADRATKAPLGGDTVLAVMRRMRDHGVLGSVMGGAIELAPPFIVENTDLDRAAEVIARSVAEVAHERELG